MKKLALLAVHARFAVFNMLAAVYCLLAYLPFTYHQIHEGHLLPWLDNFVQTQILQNLTMLPLALLLTIEPWRRGGAARWLAAGFGVLQLATASALTVHPVLASLKNDSTSLVWSLIFLSPVAWLAAMDIACYAGQVQWVEKRAGQGASLFATAWGAVFVSFLYTAVYFLRHPGGLNLPEEATVLGWSLLAHLLCFLGLFLFLECVAGLAGLSGQPAKMEFWLCHLLLAAAIAAVSRMVVWPAVGLDGWQSYLFSVAVGLTLASLNAGMAVLLTAGQPVSDGVAAAAAPATAGLAPSWRSGAAALVGLGVIGAWMAVSSAALDWNYLLQKLTAAAVWLASFGGFYAIGAGRVRSRSMAWLAVPLVFLGAYKGLEAAAPGAQPWLEQRAGYDASFLLARQVLAPPKHDDGSFYQFLNRNTNIPASVHVDPVPVELVPGLTRSPEPPPNIFIFTIDSLRRDYLSPYNAAVRFTPSIGAFAQESTVFENAFTRYGGTGLSEPAIWAGALLLHKQYMTPFAPMNALEKLIAAEQYRVFLSRDSVLQTLLTPSRAAVELDAPEATMTLDFARTLVKLQQLIEGGNPQASPIFVYTQPQNLHISVIQRQGASVPPGEKYAGFYAPYASRLEQMDGAFGRFVAFLKARGLYDRSIIVLTADHGDSLGEEGRWGHAYTLFPEVVRIPLIVHLPESLRGKAGSDPASLAFSTDITPSLYYLLGHRPIQKNELFGSALFTETPTERQRDPQASYLVASSYAAVYGLLSDGGRRLYIADAVNYRNYLFHLDPRGASAGALNPGFEQEQNELIRRQILSINRFYRFGGAPGGRP